MGAVYMSGARATEGGGSVDDSELCLTYVVSGDAPTGRLPDRGAPNTDAEEEGKWRAR